MVNISRKRILIKGIIIMSFCIICLLFSQSASAAEFDNTIGNKTITINTTITGEKWIKGGDLTINPGSTLQINPDSKIGRAHV